MKKIIIPILCIIIIFNSCSEKIEEKGQTKVSFYPGDTIIEQILSFNSWAQLNGIYMSSYKNGKPLRIESYKDGAKEGQAVYFYENGNIKSTIQYKAGKKNGIVYEYYPSGYKQSEAEWYNDTMYRYVINYYDENPNPIVYWEYDSLGHQTYKRHYDKEGKKIISEEGVKRR